MRVLKNLFFIFWLSLQPIICISQPMNNPYLVFKVNAENLRIDKNNIKSADMLKSNDGSYGLNIELTSDAAKKLSNITAANIGKTAFIYYGNNKLISKSTIQTPLGSKFQISHFPGKEGKKLINSLKMN